VFSFFGTPTVTSEKLNGKNYISWTTSVELWPLGQRFIIPMKMAAEKFHQRILSSGRNRNFNFVLCFSNPWNPIY